MWVSVDALQRNFVAGSIKEKKGHLATVIYFSKFCLISFFSEIVPYALAPRPLTRVAGPVGEAAFILCSYEEIPVHLLRQKLGTCR